MNKAFKSSKALSQKSGKSFELKFKSKKDRKDCCSITSRLYNTKNGEGSFLKKIHSSEPLPNTIPSDSRIIKDKLSHFYIIIPMEISEEIFIKNQENVSSREKKVLFIFKLGLFIRS